jgi:hypothetical protein
MLLAGQCRRRGWLERGLILLVRLVNTTLEVAALAPPPAQPWFVESDRRSSQRIPLLGRW